MQLASHGARIPVSRSILSHASPARAIYIPSASIPRPRQTGSTAQKLFSKTRTLVGRFVTHLTTPGAFSSAPVPTVGRSIHSSAVRGQNIQSRLSLPARYALSTPLHAPKLPKAPVLPRSTTQVGFGTARNFHSGRPIFDNLVQNVPVAGRAFCEADWDTKMRKRQSEMKFQKKEKENKQSKKPKMMSQEIAKPKDKKVKEEKVTVEQEMEHFFPAPVVPDVTTHLYIPLAPTPTSRMPLSLRPPSFSSSAPNLLPISALSDMHASYHTHSLRVSSLFGRLDGARVWERGATCSAYSYGDGVATALRVTFEGWSEAAVRGVLGESGSGWCELEEVSAHQQVEDDQMCDGLSDISEVDSGVDSHIKSSSAHSDHRFEDGGVTIDPAASFVLPTIDFSSSFYATSRQSVTDPFAPVDTQASMIGTPSSHATELDNLSDMDADDHMSISSGSDFASESWVQDSISDAESSWYGGFGFSSEFSGRLEEPREMLF